MSKIVDYDKIAELNRQGYTAAQIATRVGCCTRVVSRWRVRTGAAKPLPVNAGSPVTLERLESARRLLADGASQKETAVTLGMSRATLRRYFPGQVWTRQEAGHQAQMVRQLNRIEAFV